MFYSRTLLARKSALGTVWIAAHLERRLRRPQIDAIDIPSYADCIMVPEVPIALRLSAHLLLGLVRIYSWKVDYIYRDCNRMRIDIKTASASVELNLQLDIERAPFEEVTLPQTFDLDSFELGDAAYEADRNPVDEHTRTYEQITLPDPALQRDEYVAVYIDEKDTPNPVAPELPKHDLLQFEDHMTTTVAASVHEMDTRDPLSTNIGGAFSESFTPEVEIMRDAAKNFDMASTHLLNDIENDHRELVEHSNNGDNVEKIVSPVFGDFGNIDERIPVKLLHSHMHHRPSSSIALEDSINFEAGMHLGDNLPTLLPYPALLPSPVERPRARRRKRGQAFDESLVLSNAILKRQLRDTSDLITKRQKLPCSNKDVWTYNTFRMKEQMFNEPLVSGMTSKIKEVYNGELPLLGGNEEEIQMEIPRFNSSQIEENLNDRFFSPAVDMIGATPINSTSSLPLERTSIIGDLAQTIVGIGTKEPLSSVLETDNSRQFQLSDYATQDTILNGFNPEVNILTEFTDNEIEVSPHTTESSRAERSEGSRHFSGSGVISPPSRELDFLHSRYDSSWSQAGSLDFMSTRTRAVEKYLKEQLSATQVSNDLFQKLSLKKSLEGKTRRQCARIFFEILVLKNYCYVDVQQEEPYGDILIALSQRKL